MSINPNKIERAKARQEAARAASQIKREWDRREAKALAKALAKEERSRRKKAE